MGSNGTEMKLKSRRFFKILIGPHAGKIGRLIGKIDYVGCPQGWHTLMLGLGTQCMYAGDEIREMAFGAKTEGK